MSLCPSGVGYVTRFCDVTGVFVLENSSACINLPLLRIESAAVLPSRDLLLALRTITETSDFFTNCGSLDTINIGSILNVLGSDATLGGVSPEYFADVTSKILTVPRSSFASILSGVIGRVVLSFQLFGLAIPLAFLDTNEFILSIYRATNLLQDVIITVNDVIISEPLPPYLSIKLEAKCSGSLSAKVLNLFDSGNFSSIFLQILRGNQFDGILYANVTSLNLVRSESFFAYIPISETVTNSFNVLAYGLNPGELHAVTQPNVVAMATQLLVGDVAGYNWTGPNATSHIVLPNSILSKLNVRNVHGGMLTQDVATDINTTYTRHSAAVVFMQYINDYLFPSRNASQKVDSIVASVSYPSDFPLSGAFFFVIAIPTSSISLGNNQSNIYQCALYDKSVNQWNTGSCSKDEQRSNDTSLACWCTVSTPTVIPQLDLTVPVIASDTPPSTTVNFACLTIPGGSSNAALAPSSAEAQALQYITYIGIGVSVPCCMVLFFVFMCVRQLRTFGRFIIMNLALSLAAALLLFVTAISKTQNVNQCRNIAIALHYLLLVAFGWMLANGWYLINFPLTPRHY